MQTAITKMQFISIQEAQQLQWQLVVKVIHLQLGWISTVSH